MPPRFKGFNVEEPSSTRVDIPVPVGADPNRFGNIKQYKPNLIDKISGLIPDTEIGGVLKGLYRGTDDALFGLLPSGNYESVTPETKLGEQMSFIADPIAGAKGVKYAVSGGTPISRLIANSIDPQIYSNKWPELKRVLTNPRVLKEAVIDDIPQWKQKGYLQGYAGLDDRLFAWRKKLGLGKPNEKYNQALDLRRFHNYNIDKKDYHLAIGAELGVTKGKKVTELTSGQYLKRIKDYEQDTPINRIWNKFGSHTEDGKKYYHYKNPDDYFRKKGKNTHGLFGNWGKKTRMKGSEELGGVLREDYYDNWDFARNRSLNKRMELPFKRLFQTGDVKEFVKRELNKLPVSFQRGLAEALLKPLEFKGTAKKIYRKPSQSQIEAMQTVKDYFGTGVKNL